MIVKFCTLTTKYTSYRARAYIYSSVLDTPGEHTTHNKQRNPSTATPSTCSCTWGIIPTGKPNSAHRVATATFPWRENRVTKTGTIKTHTKHIVSLLYQRSSSTSNDRRLTVEDHLRWNSAGWKNVQLQSTRVSAPNMQTQNKTTKQAQKQRL